MSTQRHVLVTGGAGYIGTHTCVALAEHGFRPVVVDSFVNSSPRAIEAAASIANCEIDFYEGDVRDRTILSRVFGKYDFLAVMHLAALKSVPESVLKPLVYFDNNIGGTISLLEEMQSRGVSRLVFSSSATVYGALGEPPVTEDSALDVTNAYGRSKLVMEQLMTDVCRSDPNFGVTLLRYFNPVGAHASGLIGEDPRGIPGNLLPFVAQVAAGRLPRLQVFGSDWPTCDGTGVRDYLHVVDLAGAHVSALRWLLSGARGATAINLGTGRGTSVLELVREFEVANGVTIPWEFADRRPGDVAAIWADATLAGSLLGWRPVLSLTEMCIDAWRWQLANPRGFGY